jgi:hypothetical protein
MTGSTDYTLMKLDKIEDMIREVRQLLLDRQTTPSTVTGIVSSRLEKWLFSFRPLAILLFSAVRQAVAVAVIVHMARGGSLGPMEPYINYFLGTG